MRNDVHAAGVTADQQGHDRHSSITALALGALASLGLAACGGSGSGASVPLGPPVSLSYATTSVEALRDVFVPPMKAAYQGGSVAFSVKPAFPDGLHLNSVTGEITGRPTVAAPETTYVVTASNAAGSVHANIDLEVHAEFDQARVVYGLNSTRSEISIWRYDADTNTLVPSGTVGTGLLPIRAEADPLGRFLFVACAGQERIAVHRIDPLTGNLEPVELVTADGATFDIAIDPSGRFLYKSNLHVGTIQAFLIDPASGHLALTGPSVPVPGPAGLTISKDGRHLFAGSIEGDAIVHYGIDEVTGAIEGVLDVVPAGDPVDLYYDDDYQRLYAVDFLSNRLHTFLVDPVDGHFTELFDTPTFGGPAALVMNAGELYVLNHSDALVSRFKLDGPSGEPQPWTATSLAGRPTQIAMLGPGLDAVVALDDVGLVGQVHRDDAGDLSWSDSRPTSAAITDVVVVNGPKRESLLTVGLFAATAQSLELASILKTESGLETMPATLPVGLDPARIAIDGQNERLFVVSRGSDQISAFAFDDELGLSALEVSDAGYMPRDAAVVPGGKALLTLDADHVVLRSIGADGALAALDSETVGSMPCHVAVHPSGRFAFVTTDDNVFTYAVDARLGTLERLFDNGLSFAAGSAPSGLAISPDGAHMVVVLEGTGRLHVAAIDPMTGDLTSTGTLATGFDSSEPNFDATGSRLLTVEPVEGKVSMFSFAPNGTLSLLSRADCGSDARGVAVDRNGHSVYGAAAGSDSIEVLAVDGTGTTIAPDTTVDVGAGTKPQVVVTASLWREQE
ncbi:MAG: beta-propeller fold lactonase family protein [Planctomycetota bacterium]